MSAADARPDVIDVLANIEVGQLVPIVHSSVCVIPINTTEPETSAVHPSDNVTIPGEITQVASVYLARWSAPIKVNGIAIGHGTGHEFGWDGARWVSLGAFRRGGPRPGQWGGRARKRRAKRRERAGHIRSYKRFDRYLDTRQGQNWFELENARDAHLETVAAGDTANIQSGTGGIRLASSRTVDLGNEREDT